MRKAEKFDPYALLEKLQMEKGGGANYAKRANLDAQISTNSTISTERLPESDIAAPPECGTIQPAVPTFCLAPPVPKPVVSRTSERACLGAGKGDAEAYADALRLHGPCGYGGIATALGWGAGRASVAEIELRKAGRIVYPDKTGRGWLVEKGETG